MKKQRSWWLWCLGLVLVVLVVLVIVRWPAFEIRAWTPPKLPAATGAWAPNEELVKTEMIGDVRMVEPEDVVVNEKGEVFAGCSDGKIWKIDSSGKSSVVADTKGRPLGLVFGKDGLLYVADGIKGILTVDTKGRIKVVTDKFQGKLYSFIDDLDVDDDGNIYYTDASLLVSVRNGLDVRPDILSRVPTGRLFKYEAKTKKVTLLHSKLYFANGVVLSKDQSFLLVTETGNYSVVRLWLKGPKKGKFETFARNLRGYPDNIDHSSDGGFWIGLTTPRLADVEKNFHPRAWLKKFLFVLPTFMLPKPIHASLVVKLDSQGKVVQSLQDPKGKTIANVTSAFEYKGHLYLGHIYNKSTRIGRYKLNNTAAQE